MSITGKQAEGAPPGERASVARMRERWRSFAREDAMYYVATNREDWSAEDFLASGADFVADVLAWAGPGLGRGRMVEIGCGAGRMIAHFAPHFERVEGVDIAAEMVEAARAGGLPDNVHLAVTSGADLAPLPDGELDFVFSTQVFQHIPDSEVLAAYIAETARVLRPGARAMLHFDTRPRSLRRRLALALPDRLLPRSRRRYIRRYSVPVGWPAERAAAAGLTLVDERDPGSPWHMHLFERR